MIRTIDELLELIEEENLWLDIDNALINNYSGFGYTNFEGKLVGQSVYMPTLDMTLPIDEEYYRIFKEKGIKYVHVVHTGGENCEYIARIVPNRDEKDENNNLLLEDIKIFLEVHNVNTRGKLLKLLYDAYDIYKKEVGKIDDYRLMRDLWNDILLNQD